MTGVMPNAMLAKILDIGDAVGLGTFAPSLLLPAAVSWLPLQVWYPTCHSPRSLFVPFPSVSAAIRSSPP